MKTRSRIRNLVVAAVSAVAIVTALTFAMAQPKPQGTPPPPFRLTITCAPRTADTAKKILEAINNSPSLRGHPERHNLQVDHSKPIGGGTMPTTQVGPCGAHFTPNVTQHALFLNGSDLKKFLIEAGL